MGMLYRRKKRDAKTGALIEVGPYWMKYYIEGRPFHASTKTSDWSQAKNILKQRESVDRPVSRTEDRPHQI